MPSCSGHCLASRIRHGCSLSSRPVPMGPSCSGFVHNLRVSPRPLAHAGPDRRVGQGIAHHCFWRRGDGSAGRHGERELFRRARRTSRHSAGSCPGRESHALVTSGHRVLSRILEISAWCGPFGHWPDGHRERQSLRRHRCGPKRLSRHLYRSPGGRVGSAHDAAPVAPACRP